MARCNYPATKSDGGCMIKNLFRDEILDDRFISAIDLFNKNQLKDSYNILFDLWKNTVRPNRKLFFLALLKSNAALQLLEQKKFHGARRVFLSAIKNLMNFNGLFKPFDINKFNQEIIEYFEYLNENYNPEIDIEYIDFPVLNRPKIRYDLPEKFIRYKSIKSSLINYSRDISPNTFLK